MLLGPAQADAAEQDPHPPAGHEPSGSMSSTPLAVRCSKMRSTVPGSSPVSAAMAARERPPDSMAACTAGMGEVGIR